MYSDHYDNDPGYGQRVARYRETITPERAMIDADELRKLLAYIEGQGSAKTKECANYRAWVLQRLRSIVDGDGYPTSAVA